MNSILEQIIELVDQGFSHQEIAEKLQITVGKVRYQLYKKRQPETKQQESKEVELKQTELKPIPIETKAKSVSIEDNEVYPSYGEDQLILLPQTPTSFYTYWEVSEERKRLIEEHFSCSWSVLPKVLRVYDVTDLYFNGDNAHYYTDVEVHDLANNWFIRDLEPKRNYCLDFGTRTLDGRFFTILRSNLVALPPSDIQPWREHEKWTRPTETKEPTWLHEFTGYTIHK